jgi:hypothetical protein
LGIDNYEETKKKRLAHAQSMMLPNQEIDNSSIFDEDSLFKGLAEYNKDDGDSLGRTRASNNLE